MMFWTISTLAVLIVSVVSAGILIPQILLVAFRKELFDVPDERKIHRLAVPRLGGIAFAPVVCFSVSFVLGVTMAVGYDTLYQLVIEDIQSFSLIVSAVIMLYLVGLADDLIGVRYRAKFVVQILCALLLVGGGMSLSNLHGALFIESLPIWLVVPFTILLVVFVINAINLIDGVDGLASGLTGIALLFYGVIFCMLQEYLYALVAFSTLGTVIPFFYYNVFGKAEKHKKIFMGDTGALTIGLLLCFLSLKLCSCETESFISANPLVLAFAPLLVPCFDVVRVFLRRIRNHKNPFMPDKLHIHHKLMGIGLNQRVTMISILLISLAFSAISILLSHWIDVNLILLLDLSVWILFNMWLTKKNLIYRN